MGWAIVAIIISTPLILGLGFRVQSSHIFFSIMAGELLARYLVPINNQTDAANLTRISLIILPSILTSIILKGSITKFRVILNIIPLLFTGVILATFLFELLQINIKTLVDHNIVGKFILDNDNWIIVGTVVIQLLALWLTNRGAKNHHESKADE